MLYINYLSSAVPQVLSDQTILVDEEMDNLVSAVRTALGMFYP